MKIDARIVVVGKGSLYPICITKLES